MPALPDLAAFCLLHTTAAWTEPDKAWGGSFLELYNEETTDLLAVGEAAKAGAQKLRIMEDRNGVVVQGLEEMPVKTSDDIYALLDRGSSKRRWAALYAWPGVQELGVCALGPRPDWRADGTVKAADYVGLQAGSEFCPSACFSGGTSGSAFDSIYAPLVSSAAEHMRGGVSVPDHLPPCG